MSDWYIQKSGFSSDSVLGPLTSEQVIALFNRGEIKKKTPIASQQHTGNEWMIFGKTVLWKQAQEADQLQKQKKEQAAAELKKQQEQEEIQIQQQVVVADRQPPVVAQPLPTAVQVASTVPPSNQQLPSAPSVYRRAVSQRFETSNSILDLFDWKFEKYVTPLIIRITWMIVVVCSLIATVFYLVGPDVWVDILVAIFDSSSGSSGTEFRIPDWMIEFNALVVVRILMVVRLILILLWFRVILELFIVIFNIARGISNIEGNTESDQ